jgi:hypothetical protein
MLLLGLVLLAATGAFTGLLISENWAGGPDYTVTMFNHTLGTLNSLQIFLAAIALTLVFCLGLAMAGWGARYARRRRVTRRATLREAQRTRAERDALAARLEDTSPSPAGQTVGEEAPVAAHTGANRTTDGDWSATDG